MLELCSMEVRVVLKQQIAFFFLVLQEEVEACPDFSELCLFHFHTESSAKVVKTQILL